MIVLFLRHGNTFHSGETPYWVGSEQDLPLVDSGIQQIQHAANALSPFSKRIVKIISGPLIRTKQSADIIKAKLNFYDEISIDHRLIEINYGKWGGKTNEDLVRAGYHQSMIAWDNNGTYPDKAGWKTTEQDLIEATTSLLHELKLEHGQGNQNDIYLLVTSNGLLKYFLRHDPKAFRQRGIEVNIKVKTGFFAALNYTSSGWQEVFWNIDPVELKLESFSKSL